VQRSAMRRCLKGLGGRPTSTDGFILGPVTRHSGSACFFLRTAKACVHASGEPLLGNTYLPPARLEL
jgi:hypothetical protein